MSTQKITKKDLLVKAAEFRRAVELLALVIDHPSSEQESKDQARGLQAELESELPVLVAATAQASGRARVLEEVVHCQISYDSLG